MQIGELKVRLGVDADTFKVKDFARALGEIPFSVAAGLTALTGMSFALTDMMKNTLGLANNLSVFTTTTGQSANELQRWTSVAKQLGLNTDSVQGSVSSLIKTFAQFKITGAIPDNMIMGMGKLGMAFDPNKNPFVMMREALVKAAKMPNRATAAEALNMMGIDPSLIQMGMLSEGKFNKMAIVTLDDDGIRAMKEFQVELAQFELTIAKAFTPALVAATPIMGKLAESLADLIKTIGPVLFRGTANAVGNVANLAGWFKQGSLEDFEHIVDGFVAGIGYIRNDQMGSRMSSMSLTNHIHSNADPEAVAGIVNEFTARYHRKAMDAFNNGGR